MIMGIAKQKQNKSGILFLIAIIPQQNILHGLEMSDKLGPGLIRY
jgi:hypothetical protein